MSRATAVKKKPIVKAVKAMKAAKAKKVATRTAAPKAHKPARNNKPVAKLAKAAVHSSKPALKPASKPVSKPAATKPVSKSASKSASKSTAPRSDERYAGMTESEILRAPASQYMNSSQCAFFRERLLAIQR